MWGLKVLEKDERSMKRLSNENAAFFRFYFFEGDSIMSIGSAGGDGSYVYMMFFDYEKISISKLESLANYLVDGLEKIFQIKFCSVNVETSICDDFNIKARQ